MELEENTVEEVAVEETVDKRATTFIVTIGTEDQLVEGREAAVTMAKEVSAEQDRRVTVERQDGRVVMQFYGGSLDSFVWETRPRKK